jgi:hypothetical protein
MWHRPSATVPCEGEKEEPVTDITPSISSVSCVSQVVSQARHQQAEVISHQGEATQLLFSCLVVCEERERERERESDDSSVLRVTVGCRNPTLWGLISKVSGGKRGAQPGVGFAVAGSLVCLMATAAGWVLPVSTRVQQPPCAIVVFGVSDSDS